MDKVYDGTPMTCTSLCHTCRGASRVIGINFQEYIRCYAFERFIHFPVVRCTRYDDKRLPSVSDMKDIAWIVESRNRGPVGFTADKKTEIVVSPPRKYGDVPMPTENTGG